MHNTAVFFFGFVVGASWTVAALIAIKWMNMIGENKTRNKKTKF